MNFLKGLIGLNKPKSNALDYTKYCGEGRLYFVGKKKECIFITCTVRFVPHKTKPFQYNIHVQNTSEQAAYGANEYFFPIIQECNFRSHFQADEDEEIMYFEWELKNKSTIGFEFDNQINDLTQADQFKEIFCQLLYEVTYQQSVSQVKNPIEYNSLCRDKTEYEKEKQAKEMEEIMKKVGDMKLSSTSKSSEDPQNSKKPNPSNENKVPEEKKSEEAKANPKDIKQDIPIKLEKGSKLIYKVNADLIQIDANGKPIPVCPDVQAAIVDVGAFEFRYEVFDSSGNKVYSRYLTSEMNYHIETDTPLFKWVETVHEDLVIYALSLKVTASQAKEFKFLIARCILENASKGTIEDLFKIEEIDYGMRLIAGDIEEEQDKDFYSNSVQEFENLEIEIEDNFYRSQKKDPSDAQKNTGLVQAKLLDRAFVSKSSTISVYGPNENETELEHLCNLPVVKSLNGNEIKPKKMVLHEQDSKVILLNNELDKKVFYMDLEKGKVIEELHADGENTLVDVHPTTKHSEFSTNPCFLALNPRNIFKIDPRIHGKNKIASQYTMKFSWKLSKIKIRKVYAKSPNFTLLTSTDNEHFATGSENGEIRLFKEVGQNAKTLYPGLGDPIIGLDTTKDGKWLLATTKTYLVLLPTFSGAKNGYTHPLGKEKAIPKKLRLSVDDLRKYYIKEVKFSPAKFNDSQDGKERFIVTSSGEFIITWGLIDVIKGKTFKYEIKKLDEKVVLDEFRYNREDNLIITTPNEVRIQKVKVSSLKK